MHQRLVSSLSGVFVLTQLLLSSAGVWADARQELAIFSADVHVESPNESCLQAHDHRLCILCRGTMGVTGQVAILPASPHGITVASVRPSTHVDVRAQDRSLPPTRAPPLFA